MSHSRVLTELNRHPRWRGHAGWVKRRFSADEWRWVNDAQSLTERLIALSDDAFSVTLLRQCVGIPRWHEQCVLGQENHIAATVREVVLNVDGAPQVLARSIIPQALMAKFNSGLSDLGTQPLGQLLFTDGRVRVRRRQFARVEVNGVKYVARRTPYEYLGSVILVAEFYAPTLIKRPFK